MCVDIGLELVSRIECVPVLELLFIKGSLTQPVRGWKNKEVSMQEYFNEWYNKRFGNLDLPAPDLSNFAKVRVRAVHIYTCVHAVYRKLMHFNVCGGNLDIFCRQ